MRIAYFTDTYLPQINGVSNTLKRLGEYLAEKEIKHMVFAPQYEEIERSQVPSPVVRFKSISVPFYPECRLSFPLYANLSRLADQFAPDLVHLTDPLGIGLAGLRYARERGIPIVSSFHTNFDDYLKYYNLEYLENVVWGLFKWFHRFSDLNFCPSIETLKILENKGIKNLRLWSRGIDMNTFSPKLRDSEIRKQFKMENKTTFLYVGRLAAEKDLDILIAGIERVNVSYADKVQFILVGEGPYAKLLKERTDKNVLLTGYLEGQELARIYASCDAFVFPSSTETFGNVVLEAMASGLPVIAVNAGGVKDNVLDSYNGLMCSPRDSENLAKAIITLIEDKILLKILADNALKHIKGKSWSSIFDQLVADYSSVLQIYQDKLSRTA
ncbi:glycosyl transferase group 1 [Syntrophobotulus glycolicus DSM 8271]|uniref:Glycosyl transferase group 1 n=1 Tax=Syntrophobotulus glycolicus (strain DSM 8271 / FlGlyR) TaxID=645991 RepID=F0T1C7_SYNGF|nr:glycosyltransferase family 1 protein [Syntrophobotulus glycolicus]ADY56268.1 glycosyl transferase group 1 [Syntrophobotulus glycolicus DSM 8271]